MKGRAVNNLSAVQIHPKVALPVFAGALANVIVGALAGAGIVLPIAQSDLVVIIGALVGYFTPSN